MTATAVRSQPARRPNRARIPTSVVHAVVNNVEQYRPHVRRITLSSQNGWLADIPDQVITCRFRFDDRKTRDVDRLFDFDKWFQFGNPTLFGVSLEIGEFFVAQDWALCDSFIEQCQIGGDLLFGQRVFFSLLERAEMRAAKISAK